MHEHDKHKRAFRARKVIGTFETRDQDHNSNPKQNAPRWWFFVEALFTSDGVGVGVGVVRALMTWWKSKIGVVSRVISATESESEESERFHFLPTPLTTPSLTFRLWSSENQIVGVGSRSGRINQSQCTFPRFVRIGLVFPLLHATPTNQFSLDSQRNQNAVFSRS